MINTAPTLIASALRANAQDLSTMLSTGAGENGTSSNLFSQLANLISFGKVDKAEGLLFDLRPMDKPSY